MDNGWSKAEKLVFYQLKEARKDIGKLDDKIESLEKSSKKSTNNEIEKLLDILLVVVEPELALHSFFYLVAHKLL